MNRSIGNNLLAILWLVIAYNCGPQPVRAEKDLYFPGDHVILLNSTTFVPTVFHQNKNITYMVQFYNTYCGHCQMFSPIYKELAARVQNWTSVVRVAGVDCSKEENVLTCSDNKIEGYPTILIFPPNARAQEPKDKPLNLRSLNIQWTVDDIEESIVDYVANLTQSDHEHSLASEAMQPITATHVEQLDRIYPNELDQDYGRHSKADLMIIVETETSYIGRKLIIDYFRIHKRLELRRVLDTNKEFLTSILTDEQMKSITQDLPILIRLGDHDNPEAKGAQILVKGEASHILPTSTDNERDDTVYERFKTFFEHFYAIELNNQESNGFYKHTVSKSMTSNEISQDPDVELLYQRLLESVDGDKVFAIDILKGISYMLTHEVLIKGDLSPKEFTTVRNLLTVLKKYLPLEQWDPNMSKFIVDLRTRLDGNRLIYEKIGITGQELRDHMQLAGMETIKSRYSKENWISCHKSDRDHKGYTCSLWLLFHTLTAGEYVKAPPVRSRPTLVLYTMRDYITKFLGCTICSSNFAKETESLETSLTSRNSSVIWLWYTHNLVNQRLNNERQVKRTLREVIFPSYEQCPKCYRDDPQQIGQDGQTFQEISYDLERILHRMLRLYKPDEIYSPARTYELLTDLRNDLKYKLLESSSTTEHILSRRFSTSGDDLSQSEKWKIHSLLSTGDISLWLFLYVACIVMVGIVYFFLNPRWKKHKAKF